jgi:hypothetical protein
MVAAQPSSITMVLGEIYLWTEKTTKKELSDDEEGITKEEYASIYKILTNKSEDQLVVKQFFVDSSNESIFLLQNEP